MSGDQTRRRSHDMIGIQARFLVDWPSFSLNVDLDLPPTGITAIFGHSGSGKTTLLRCIAGLERAPLGRLVVDGSVWQDAENWMPTHMRPIGYVFQEASLFPHLTVMGNLRYGMRRIAQGQRVNLDQAIELLGIGHLLNRKVDRLSGGERQRVSIARALVVSPRLLLMDEPLASLDLKRKQEILPYLERLHAELEVPVLYVSHSPDEVSRLADYLVVMDAGRAIAQGPLLETLTRLDLPIHLGEDVGVVLDAIVGERDEVWHLARLDFIGGGLWLRDEGIPVGRRARVRVLARDVSLAIEHHDQTSIQNLLPGRVDAVADDEHPALVLVRVQIGECFIISRLTKRSAATLGIVPGRPIWVQVKSAVLTE
jgi:molybdate transport system ATP-binding protein